MTSFLSFRGKVEAIRLMGRLAALNTRPFELITVQEWAGRFIRDAKLRAFFLSLCRVVTFSGDEQQCAAVALDQMKLAMLGVIYVDEGWQKIVDSLHSHAVSAGVNFVTSSRVVRVEVDNEVRAIEIGGLEADRDPLREEVAARVPADTVLLAVDPTTAANLVSNRGVGEPWRSLQPITVASLDVALSRLPDPKQTFAIGIDKPFYFSVHSKWAHLSPHGGALVHVAKYRSQPCPSASADYDGEMERCNEEARRDQAELETLLDDLQPGWREVVVHKRFLPSLAVANAMKSPTSYRPHPETAVRGLYIAGDWVGGDGVMADAALTSARAAARAILARA